MTPLVCYEHFRFSRGNTLSLFGTKSNKKSVKVSLRLERALFILKTESRVACHPLVAQTLQ